MIYVPTELLQQKMIIATDVNTDVSRSHSIPLIRKGQIVTDILIKKLINNNIDGVYVNDEFSSYINTEIVVTKQLKKEVLESIEANFNNFKNNRGEINFYIADSIVKIAKSLVLNVLSNDSILDSLVSLKCYDDYTYRHSLCVAILCITIGISLNLDAQELVDLATCALLHDIGKISIPISIIDKPDLLTPDEYELIKNHPSTGAEILKNTNLVSETILRGIETHHEKFDGTGYPYGLKGKEIPLYGRILAIADVYDAITSTRSYRRACFPSEAIEYIMASAETHFDIEILRAFLKNIAAYPIGCIVELSNGSVATVVKNIQNNALRPVIRLISDDGTYSDEIDLGSDRNYASLTIVGMGYYNKSK